MMMLNDETGAGDDCEFNYAILYTAIACFGSGGGNV